ncbi:MAG TPA: type II secretion system F family protein [Bacteroidia bacterium]|nr:type II secretion system F family protein [Bacteroidia bacterium]
MIDISNIPQRKNSPAQKTPGILEFLNRDIKIFGSSMNDRKKERFYSELHTLLVAGIDIRTAFELLESEAEKKEEKTLFRAILDSIVSGRTLPEAIEQTGKFSRYEFYSLRIGEESGRMSAVLKDLAQYYAKKIKQKRKVTSALSYPLIVIVIALLAVGFMLRFVVPMFADMLARFGTELPGITKWIISASGAMEDYGLWILLSIISLIVLGWSQRKHSRFRKISSALVLRIPYIGKITQKVYVERFAHAMHLLLASKTNLTDALDLVQKMAGFYPIEHSLETIRRDILAGTSLHESLSKFPVYPKRMVSLIRVAEEVNQLDMMFEKLSVQLSDEIEHETSVLGSIIEPLMIMFLGVMVAVILVAMYLPMFKLGSAFE